MYKSISDLPDPVKKLPEAGQKQWMTVFNQAFHEYNGDEKQAFSTAWYSVRNHYSMDSEGNWHMRAAKDEGGDKEKAKEAQKARSEKYGISVRDDGNVTKPSKWSDVPDAEWADPVNYSYPCPTAEQTTAAVRYWGKSENKGKYSEEDQKKISDRLEKFEKKFEIGDDKKGVNDKDEDDAKASLINTEALIKGTEATTEENKGYKWDVQIVKFGEDYNNVYWTPGVVKASKDKFEGAKVFLLSEAQHQASRHPYGKPPDQIVGWVSGVKENDVGLEGNLNILRTARGQSLRDALVDSWDKGNKDLLGLSVDVVGSLEREKINNKQVLAVTAIKKATVDVVYEPAAGGGFLRLVAAKKADEVGKEDLEMFKDLLEKLKEAKPHIYATIKDKAEAGKVTVEDLIKALDSKDEKAQALPADDESVKAAKKILEELRIQSSQITVDNCLKDSGLPKAISDKVRSQFSGKIVTEDEVKASVKLEKDTLEKVLGETIKGAGYVKVVEDDVEKRTKMMDDFFAGKVMSFKAAYVNLTGDREVTGLIKNFDRRIMASLNSSSFGDVLGDSIRRRLLQEYNQSAYNKNWQKICQIIPIQDFRTNHRTRFGGYGNLPIVNQGAPYTALSSPTDEEATYAVSKKGGTEDVTLEMIKNDDVGVIRMIPKKMATSAARTLFEFVFDFLATNPTVYDSKALFHADHNNIATVAFSNTTFVNARIRMMSQTEMNSAKRIGLLPKYVIHPIDLTKTVYDVVAAPRNSDFDPITAEFVRTLQMEQIEVPYWTDTNNWYVSADPSDICGLEIGFLDGKQDPDIVVQDQPFVGSVFTNDKITWKIIHVYGGAITDFRQFDGNIVA